MPELPWYTNADKPFVPGHGLGRRLSRRQFPRMSLAARLITPSVVNRRMPLDYSLVPFYDQGVEGACVGFAWSWAMSILNRRRYAARKLYLEAQHVDQYDDTPPEEGTSVYAGARVLQDQGHWRFARGITFPLALGEGIESFQSAQTVDEMRIAIAQGRPVVNGVNWYSDFDKPEWMDPGNGGHRWWVGHGKVNNLGPIRGAHALCCFGARDDIEAFVWAMTWGVDFPAVIYVPYDVMERLLREDGEAIIPMDRP